MAGAKIKLNTSPVIVGEANGDTVGNMLINLPRTTPAGVDIGGGEKEAGFATMLSESDAGSVTGIRRVFAPEVTGNYRIRTGVDTTMFNEYFPGTVLNSSLWTAPATTSAIAITNGLLTLNSAASLASGAVARVSSYRHFPIYTSYSTSPSIQFQFSAVPVANMVHEWGMFLATGTAAPTEGLFMRITATGELVAVLNNNGSEITSSVISFNDNVGVGTTRTLIIYADTNEVVYWIDNTCVATIKRPDAAGSVTQSQQLPVSFRSYNTAVVTGTAQLLKVGGVNVSLSEMNQTKAWSHVMGGAGGMSYQGQTGQTLGSTALYANNQAPGAGAVMTNTTAALGVGLGGQFSALPTLAVNTDGVVCSYQVPLGTSAAPGKTLYISGVSVQGCVTTVLAGNTTPTIYAYSLAFGHTNVSLATTTSTTAKAPVRKVLGYETYAPAAAVGTLGQKVDKDFDRAPVIVQPGEFIQVAAKNIGAVTTTGVITFLVDIEGYWE
jgi:hypothetical protein